MKKPILYLLIAVIITALICVSGCTKTNDLIQTTGINHSIITPTELPTKEIQTTPTTEYHSPTISPKITPIPISESALNARIRDAKNKLETLKESDKVDTVIFNNPRETGCSYKMSKEIGYVLDSNTGDTFFIKGDYKEIWTSTFEEEMIKDHTYILLYTHPGDWEKCIVVERNSPVYNTDTYYTSFQGYYNTFSISELILPYDLAEHGYHIQEMIIVSDTNYEVYPKVVDGWKSQDEVYGAIDKIEKRMDVEYHTKDDATGETLYLMDRLMPQLTKELGYVYIVKSDVISY